MTDRSLLIYNEELVHEISWANQLKDNEVIKRFKK